MTSGSASRNAAWPLVAAATLGLAMSLIDYFTPNIGIDGTVGVLVVIGSTALMLIASAAIAFGLVGGWARGVLLFLILLDIVGTGLAAYMLESDFLIGFMALALLTWLYCVFAGGRRRAPVSAEATS